jgi:glycosyltransferase involved in cell wall biosynthesis
MTVDTLTVALIAPMDTDGGIEHYSNRLASALQMKSVNLNRVDIQAPAATSPWPFVRLIRAVPDGTDLVHLQYEAGLFGDVGIHGIWTPLVSLGLRQFPLVTTIHEVHASRPDYSRSADAVLRVRDRVLERCLIGASDRVVVHTNHAADVLKSRHDCSPSVVTMRHPVDQPVTPLVDRETARDELNIDGDFVVTTLGWIESKKRYRDVVELLPQVPDIEYLIAGEPRHDESILPALFDRAAELGVRDRVHHLGYVSEERLPVLFGGTDVAILPYTVVTQSGALNTALGYRCPVVATALPAFREVAREYACVRTYDDQSELKSVLSILRDCDEYDRSVTAAETYVTRESWSEFARMTAATYRRVLEMN